MRDLLTRVRETLDMAWPTLVRTGRATRPDLPRCPVRNSSGAACGYLAGEGTGHEGYGTCASHRGAWPASEEVWRQAVDIAQELDVTPLEAILLSVRQAGGRAAWTDAMLAEAMRKHVAGGGLQDEPSKQVVWWMNESRRERSLFAKTAKTAVDAGVAAALVQRLELEGAAVADAVAAALDALELTAEQRVTALGAAQERLLALEPGAGGGR